MSTTATPYTFQLVDQTGLDRAHNSSRVLGFSVASQLMLQPVSGTSKLLTWGPIPLSSTLPATSTTQSTQISINSPLIAFMPISVGDQVSGAGIPAGTTVTAISATVTLSQAAIASATATATITVMQMVGGSVAAASSAVSGLVPPPSIGSLRVGQTVVGANIPAGTTLTQIDGSTNSAVLSANATAATTYSGTSPLDFTVNVSGDFTSGSATATLSSLNATDQIGAGLVITQAQTLPANTQIQTITGLTLTLSQAATNSATADLSFASAQTGALSQGSNTVSGIATPGVLGVGRPVAASAIPVGAVISAIKQDGTLTLSIAASTSASDQTLSFAPASGLIPSFDLADYSGLVFDPTVQTGGLDGARMYFFVVPDSWPAAATQLGVVGYPTNPPAFPYVYASTGFGVQQPNNPPNTPSVTSSYPVFGIVEPTIDPESGGGALHIDVQTVDGFTLPLSLALSDASGNALGTVGQPVPAGSVNRAAIIRAFELAFPSGNAYSSLLYGGPHDVCSQYPGILNPGAYLANGANADSTLASIWNPVVTALYASTSPLNMVGDDSAYYQGVATVIGGCNVLQFTGHTDIGMSKPNGNVFNLYSPLTPDPLAPNSSLCAGYQVFANDGVYNDASSNVLVKTNGSSSPTPTQVALGLQRDVVCALNRGIALSGPAGATRTAGDTSYYWANEANWYPWGSKDTGPTDVQNEFSLFMHTGTVASGTVLNVAEPFFTQPANPQQTLQGLTMGQAYGFAYDENPVHAAPNTATAPAVPSKFDPVPSTTAVVTITMGPWLPTF